MPPHALAEQASVDALLDQIGLERLDSMSAERGFDARALAMRVISGKLSPDREAIAEIWKSLRDALKNNLLALLAHLCVPAVLGLFLRIMLGERGASGGAGLICRLACARAVLGTFAEARAVASGLLETTVSAVQSIAPVLSVALSLTGCSASAAVLSPLAALYANAAESYLGGVGFSFCGIAASVAVAGNLSQHFRLKRIFSTVKGCVVWLTGLTMAGLLGLMSVEGMMAAARDTTAWKSARYAVENMLPFIGGEVSGTMDALAGSVAAVRNAVGVTGAVLLLGTCGAPFIELCATVLSMKLAASTLEPAVERSVSDMLFQMADAAEMLLALCAAAIVMAVLTLGSILAAAAAVAGLEA